MKQVLPGLAKRALAFSLALVLLLALIPLDVKADTVVGDWTYKDNYSWINGSFDTSDADLVYKDKQAYDWAVTIKPQKSPPTEAQVVASIKDAIGKQISSYSATVTGLAQHTPTTLCSYKNFPELTTSLTGTFTLTCELKLNGTTYAKVVKKFTREISVSIESSVTSRSNPDKVFTFADPIDLVLNIKQTSGVAVSYNAAVTVTNSRGAELLAARGIVLPAITNITYSVKDLVNLPEIDVAGTYAVNITLTDSTTGAIRYTSSYEFSVVALEGNVTASITSATSPNFTFNSVDPDLVLNLKKTDNIAEALIATVTVTNSNGSVVSTKTYNTTTAAPAVALDLSGLSTGTFNMTVVVKDDAGNLRANASASFTCTNTAPMKCELTDNRTGVTGKIHTGGSTTSDVYLYLKITHKASAKKTVTIKAVGTLNGEPYEASTTKTLTTAGTGNVSINNSVINKYGVFEDIRIVVCDANGNELWISPETYNFSRIMPSTPNAMPLLNINDHFTSGKGDGEVKIPLAAQAGASMWRSTIPWATVEKSKGSYDISVVKSVMDTTESSGMQALIILAYGNDEIYGEPNPTSDAWLTGYKNYCYYVAKMMALYYPDQVVGFEVWNEWNHASMSKVPSTYRTGAHYATVVKAASEMIRKVNSEYGTNFKVIAGATAGDGYGESTSNTFIKAMFNTKGFFDAIDGVSFHTYSSEETTSFSDRLKDQRVFEYVSPAEHDFAARISNYKKMLTDANAPSDLEVWLTETGWTTNEVPEEATGSTDGKTHITYGATEKEAAAYMVQLYAWALYDGTLDRIFWYDFMNDISNQTKVWANNQTESNYGLIHNWNNSGNQPLAYSAKQGYVTMCALANKLGGATNGKQIHINNDSNIFAYQFSKDGKYIAVIWAEGATKTVNLTLSKSISVSDMYGNATTYNAGSTTLTLTEAPLYLEYASGAVSFG